MHNTQPAGWLFHSGLVLIVLAFLGLSLAVTAMGTARFSVALGYGPTIGYVVGGIFDLAKAVLPVALLGLLVRRAVVSFALIGIAWLGLVTYSALATHATVGLAIASIERAGTWKMEGRRNIKAELTGIEQRLAALGDPKIPRPSTTVRKALEAEKVPPRVWRRSGECRRIRRSTYFQTACAKVLSLRRELAAAINYEELEARAGDLRAALATAPLVATTDPLPKAFTATIGRVLPVEGGVGVALLLTAVLEIMSCVGLAGLRALREGQGREEKRRRPTNRGDIPNVGRAGPRRQTPSLPIMPSGNIPHSNTRSCGNRSVGMRGTGRDNGRRKNSQVDPVCKATFPTARIANRRPFVAARPDRGRACAAAHVRAFARDRLCADVGMSVGATDLRKAYEAWCATQSRKPLSQQKVGVELSALGYERWKSCGRIRYRDVQLTGSERGDRRNSAPDPNRRARDEPTRPALRKPQPRERRGCPHHCLEAGHVCHARGDQ